MSTIVIFKFITLGLIVKTCIKVGDWPVEQENTIDCS